jgi:polyferredoxin
MSENPKKSFPVISFMRKVVQFLSFFLVNVGILTLIFKTDFDIIKDMFRVLPFLQTARSAWTAGAGLIEYTYFGLTRGTIPFLFIGIIGLLGLFTGRFFCSWMCPTGFIQDLLSGLSGENRRLSLNADRSMKKLKTFILVMLFVLFAPLAYYTIQKDLSQQVRYTDAMSDLIDNPIGYFSFSEFLFKTFPDAVKSVIDNLNFNEIFNKEDWVKGLMFVLYIFLIALSVYYPRFYCKYLCPYAAMIAIFSEYSFLKLQRLPTRCPGRKECGQCELVCPMQVRILDESYEGFTGDGECTLCLNCLEKCSAIGHDAIRFKFGG